MVSTQSMKTEHVPMLCTAGDNDFLKAHGEKLIESCVDPFVIRHPKGHTVPRLGNLLCLRLNKFLLVSLNQRSAPFTKPVFSPLLTESSIRNVIA